MTDKSDAFEVVISIQQKTSYKGSTVTTWSAPRSYLFSSLDEALRVYKETKDSAETTLQTLNAIRYDRTAILND